MKPYPRFLGNLSFAGGVILPVLVIALLCGCDTTKQAQLEKAAKEWCATIRASQVIPVYPLTEDIQPGDIYLVQCPIDKQQKIYEKRGYLPLDNHLDRLNPSNYANFYSHNFLKGKQDMMLPADWIRPEGSVSNTWLSAPNAAFPSYSFSVQRGAGINLAFPVEGVPVGLSLLGSDAAEGTVIIKNAHTLGVDTISLYQQLKSWSSTNYEFLSYFGAGNKPNYLRVVSRIYTVGYVDISLRDTSSHSGGLDVGAAKPVNLLAPQLMQGTNADSTTIRSNFMAGNDALQALMTNALSAKDTAGNLLPGGSLRLTAASGRTISMRETFNPPLTIGYIGFDCAIERDGRIGPPVPTFSLLDRKFSLEDRLGSSRAVSIYFGAIEANIYQIVASQSASDRDAGKIKSQMDELSVFIPPNFRQFTYDTQTKTLHEQDSTAGVSAAGETGDYLAFRRYMGERQTSLGALNRALSESSLQYVIENDSAQSPPNKVDQDTRERLTATRNRLLRPLPPEEQQAISDATSALINYFTRKLNQ